MQNRGGDAEWQGLPSQFYPDLWCVLSQLGHDGASPESCWLVEELCLAVPTQGTKYTLRCNCWLAKDRGDGVTSRVFDLLDATVVNIGKKVWRGAWVCLWHGKSHAGSGRRAEGEPEVREAGDSSLGQG